MHYCLPSNSLCYYLFFFFLLFSATILSGPYLWNRYSQRLQIECAAWSCCLILHYSLPSNSLSYFFFLNFFLFFRRDISGTVTRRDSRLSVLLCPAVLFCTIACHPIRFTIFFFNFFFFSAKILSGPYLWNLYSHRLQIECAAWSCGLIWHYCLPSNSLR